MDAQTTLEYRCSICYGDGISPRGGKCSNCRGTGMVTTEAGDAILRLVKRHFVRLMAEAAEEAR